jgi:GntR family transcriptional regulator, rspAB operon transcriptional repressor
MEYILDLLYNMAHTSLYWFIHPYECKIYQETCISRWQITGLTMNNEDTHNKNAYSYILNKILSMEYKPGDYITDSDIAGELSISRTPVREAFQLLENEGLLQSEPRRGWRVYSLTIKDIENIFDLKCEIEGFMARKAALDQDEIHRKTLLDLIEQMKTASATNDVETWMRIDSALHHLFYVMAQNDRAERIIYNLNNQWHRLRRGFISMQGCLDDATHEHEKVVFAVINGDADGADEAMHVHLNSVRNGLVKVLVTMILPYARNGL